MKTIDLANQSLDLETVIRFARQEQVLILTADGKDFWLAEADDFERRFHLCGKAANSKAFWTSGRHVNCESRWTTLSENSMSFPERCVCPDDEKTIY